MVNPLNKKIGIVGGGQLGKMMILDAKRLGFFVAVLDPSKNCPSHSICDVHIVKSFDDIDGYRELADLVDVITYEFEHINSKILQEIENSGHEVYPSPHSLEIIQDKKTQKETLVKNGINTPDFIGVDNEEDIKKAGDKFGYPIMLKARKGGYDGKGNAVVKTVESVEESFKRLGSGSVPLIAEKFCHFEKEISVLACRDKFGEISVYPVAENIHVDSILDETLVPASISEESRVKAMDMAYSVMEIFSDVGMFCTEMFVAKNGDILLNEVAPRPHNSGHYTIEGCYTSQYEAHIKGIVGLPIGDVSLRIPTAMKNILGHGNTGKCQITGEMDLHSDAFVKLHIYGKEESKPKRKMAHITAIGETLEIARERVNRAHNKIKIFGL